MIANAGQVSTFRLSFIRRFKPTIYTLALTATVLFGSTTIASAQPATCDPAYWDSLKAKAWTEAEREIEQNQNYIYKADSVLQYTCFDQFLNVLTDMAPEMFSETSEWGGITGTDMGAALQGLVGESLGVYVDNNFRNVHTYLGGFSSIDGYEIDSVSGGSYDCDQMQQVWMAAKCQDIANASTDNDKENTSASTDFFYMSNYSTNEYRNYPNACAMATNWAATYATSINSDNHYARENYNIYANFFRPTTCTGGVNNATALPATIPTGVRVRRRTAAGALSDYPEIICVAPGCASNADGTACTDVAPASNNANNPPPP